MVHRGKKHIRKTKDIVKEEKTTKLFEKEERKRGIKKVLVDIADLPRISRETEAMEERKKREQEKTPEAIAQKSIDIQQAKKDIKAKVSQERAEEIKEIEKKTAEPLTIETEIITFTDESGVTRRIEKPIGTLDKMNAAAARREGLVPFSELPEYQQFLVGAAVMGVSPGALKVGGKTLNLLGKPLTKFMTSTLGKYVAGITTFSGIMTWLASDNIIGTMSIYTRDLAEDVTFGKISKEEALEKINEGDEFVEKARNFIKTATIINPLLWAFRGIILANADAAQLAIEENKERIRRA